MEARAMSPADATAATAEYDRGLMKKKAQLLAALAEMFYPHVARIMVPRCADGIVALVDVIRSKVDEVSDLVASLTHGGDAALDAHLRELKAGLAPNSRWHKLAQRQITETVETNTVALVRAWLDVYMSLRSIDRHSVIDAGAIDGDMLPPLAVAQAWQFVGQCADAGFTAEEARAILRKVRETLPPGKRIPDAATEFLNIEVIDC